MSRFLGSIFILLIGFTLIQCSFLVDPDSSTEFEEQINDLELIRSATIYEANGNEVYYVTYEPTESYEIRVRHIHAQDGFLIVERQNDDYRYYNLEALYSAQIDTDGFIYLYYR